MKKQFTEKQVEKKIVTILKKLEGKKYAGKKFCLKSVIGDYQFNNCNRSIKEVLFSNVENHGRYGSTWILNYPKESATKLAKRVMAAKNVTFLNARW